jgi:hypothetical protein
MHYLLLSPSQEPVDRVGEAVLAIAVRHEIRSPLHLRTGIAHRNAKTTPLEHRNIIAAIADDGDLRQRNSQQPREFRQCDPLVGKRMGNVEVVRLRTSNGSLISQRGSQISLTLCNELEVLADPDDLGGYVEDMSEIVDHRRSEPHRVFLEPDIRPVGVPHQPILPAENPDLHLLHVEHVDRAPRDLGRQQMLGNH